MPQKYQVKEPKMFGLGRRRHDHCFQVCKGLSHEEAELGLAERKPLSPPELSKRQDSVTSEGDPCAERIRPWIRFRYGL